MFGPVPFIGSPYPRPKFFASATSVGTTITGPAGITAGNLLVMVDLVWGGSSPTTAVPTGFSAISNVTNSNRRQILSYKVADGTEAGATLTGMTAGAFITRKSLICFRGGKKITTASSNDPDGILTADPSAQTITSGSGTAPLVVIGAYTSHMTSVGTTGPIDPRTFTVSGSPAKDGEFENTGTNSSDLWSSVWIAWKVYFHNQTPANVVVDMENEGSANGLQSCYIAVS